MRAAATVAATATHSRTHTHTHDRAEEQQETEPLSAPDAPTPNIKGATDLWLTSRPRLNHARSRSVTQDVFWHTYT